LTLFHEDESATEYPGIGTNGDRAAEVAESINIYLESPTSPKTPIELGVARRKQQVALDLAKEIDQQIMRWRDDVTGNQQG
jgi:hypothetical protein